MIYSKVGCTQGNTELLALDSARGYIQPHTDGTFQTVALSQGQPLALHLSEQWLLSIAALLFAFYLRAFPALISCWSRYLERCEGNKHCSRVTSAPQTAHELVQWDGDVRRQAALSLEYSRGDEQVLPSKAEGLAGPLYWRGQQWIILCKTLLGCFPVDIQNSKCLLCLFRALLNSLMNFDYLFFFRSQTKKINVYF